MKTATLEQKLAYAESKGLMLVHESEDKGKHTDKLLLEMHALVSKYEMANYKHQTSEKELQARTLDTERLEAEVKHTKALYEHFKQAFEQSQAEKHTIAKRLDEVTSEFHRNFGELAFYKQEFAGFENTATHKGDIIEELKKANKNYESKLRANEIELS